MFAQNSPGLNLVCAACLVWAGVSRADEVVRATRVEQSGQLPDGVSRSERMVLANEPDGGKAGMILDFDLSSVRYKTTPLARLQLPDVQKIPVKRPGQKSTTERGVMHVFAVSSAGKPDVLAGTLPVKPGGYSNTYTLDVTRAVSDVLARAAGDRKLRLEVRLESKPLFYEVYGVPAGANGVSPTIEIASPADWGNDWERRLEPVGVSPVVYREACLPITENRAAEIVLPLLYPAKRILEVIHNGTGEKLREGRDWDLRDGKLILPAGSHAPIQLDSEFFLVQRKDKDGTVKTSRNAIKLMEGTWYHERQMEVSYEPAARDWTFPAAISTLDQLPRLKKLLTSKSPVSIILFGDSIAAGGNASRFQGCWPYQPAFGELVADQLARHYGSKVTFMNHSRGGATSGYALTQADSQVGWLKPNLAIIAFGMNDRSDERKVSHRENMEKILDTIHQRSPETEFLVVTPMLNNPKQPMGLGPIRFIHDEELKISRPGLAFADVTTANLEMIRHKNYLDLSGNGANHPNDFLHRIYAQRILEVLIPTATRPGKSSP